MSEYTKQKISTFKERFSELCDSSPMNDTSIADALNVSRQTVCSWKAGTRSPKKPTILSIANYFRVDVAWLMGYDVSKEPGLYMLVNNAIQAGRAMERRLIEEETPKTDDIRLLVRDLNKLSPEQVEQAKEMFRLMFKVTNPELFKEDNDDET